MRGNNLHDNQHHHDDDKHHDEHNVHDKYNKHNDKYNEHGSALWQCMLVGGCMHWSRNGEDRV